MERTILDIMTDDASKITEFSLAMDELLASQYILAGVRISSVLKAIATSRVLYSLFDTVLEGFDYKATAKKCTTSEGICLPASVEEVAAFVFCVLLDIDKRNIELKDFLLFFAPAHEVGHGYKCFLEQIVAPFRQAVGALLEKRRQKDEELLSVEQREAAKRRNRLNFDRFIGTFIARINSSDLNTIIKDDLTVLCGDFSSAVHGGNEKETADKYARLIKKLKGHMPALAKELERFKISII